MEYTELDVCLEIGREGRCFTYLDGLQLGIDLGDLVLVRLKGRPMHGLVVKKRIIKEIQNESQLDSYKKKFCLANIEGLVQHAAVDSRWREWLDAMASSYCTTSFRMLKTALPPGWLGQQKRKNLIPKKFYWVTLEAYHGRALSNRQKQLKTFLIAKGGGAWLQDLNKEGFSTGLVNKLMSIGVVTKQRKTRSSQQEVRREVDNHSSSTLEAPQSLTEEQESAIDLFDSLPPGSALLLWGVTGSGKTEVYLQIAYKELELGRHCLVLTPEIGLIPQLVDRFKRRFGEKVLEYHSHCSVKERIATWQKILHSPERFVVIGTRSAVFLPLSPLGLIVLDEEHDTSYKQESPMPCYHARDMALDRAKREGSKIILGSATPSLATWRRLSPEGPIKMARLANRISRKPLPSVHVVDMRIELANGNRGLISHSLRKRLLKLTQCEEQAVVLVPKRGYSSFISCRSCGEVVQCPNCDVALTVHKGREDLQWLRCHWCDYRARIEMKCGECGSTAFKPFGTGTQRVVEHLTREIEGLRVLRFDRDSISGRDGHRRLLERFAAGEADVLIGTQMLAKGMDLHRVTLAVVLAADGLLYRPDLSAEEQALQLFMQLAGRAGRGSLPGEVLVQTYCPDHPVVRHLEDGRYEEFLNKESKVRRDAGLVPYSRACLLRLAGDSDVQTASVAKKLVEKLRPICDDYGWNIVGPAPALVSRVSSRSRWQLLLHGPELSPLPLPSPSSLWDGIPKGITLSVDPDPIQL